MRIVVLIPATLWYEDTHIEVLIPAACPLRCEYVVTTLQACPVAVTHNLYVERKKGGGAGGGMSSRRHAQPMRVCV